MEVNLKEEIQESNKIASTLTLEQVPEVLINAMSAPDSNFRGMLITEQQILDILVYVHTGLLLPTDIEQIKTRLKNPSREFDGLKFTDFQNLYSTIETHCRLWSDLEADIKTIGTSLALFGTKFVITANDIIDVIKVMPGVKLVDASKKLDGQTFPFSVEDTELRYALVELLEVLRDESIRRGQTTKALGDRLARFRATLDIDIQPQASAMYTSLKNLNVAAEIAQLIIDIATNKTNIETLQSEYNHTVGLAFTGTIGFAFIPFAFIGFIAWAITGGIFGKKAEDIRKKKKAEQDKLAKNNTKLAETNVLQAAVISQVESASNINSIIADALIGVKNLETMWRAIQENLEISIDELKAADSCLFMITLKSRMTAASVSWAKVKDSTIELVELFTQATKKANAFIEMDEKTIQ